MTYVPDEIIQEFANRANAALSEGASSDEAEAAATQALTDAHADQELIDLLRHTFERASEPEQFFNRRILAPNERFEQCYGLLCATFDEAERDPLDRFLYMLRMLQDPDNDHPLVMIGRSWSVSGSQGYDVAGHLRRFVFDPMTITDSIVGLVSGNYMSLKPVRNQATAIGAMGHLATRERFRRGRGHGSALVHAFETEVENIARLRGESVELFVLEAQPDSESFWYKQGYQWAVATRYAQPPLEFDPATGERRHDDVPETLMIKLPGQPLAPSVDAQLLADAVRTMYQNWALEKAKGYDAAAARTAEHYVMEVVFGRFLDSLPQNGVVPLGPPPSLR